MTEEQAIKLPDYIDVEQSLSRARAAVSAGEAHGILCGFICAGKETDGRGWVEPLLGHLDMNDVSAKECRGLLIKLYEVSGHQLKEMAFDFQVLLPDDDDALSARAAVLGDWCQGFMSGLGLAGLDIESAQSEDSKDALYHFSEIAKIDYDNLDISEDDERAYTEVVEYVRMAVLMIYAELATSGQSQKSLH